jgi:hypothetical protein
MAEQEPHAAQTERTTEGVASRVPIWDLVRYYLRLSALGFGGPVALCGQMERELVGERKWLTRDEMREAIAVCQSLPGPLAIQVGIFISYLPARRLLEHAPEGRPSSYRVPSMTANMLVVPH